VTAEINTFWCDDESVNLRSGVQGFDTDLSRYFRGGIDSRERAINSPFGPNNCNEFHDFLTTNNTSDHGGTHKLCAGRSAIANLLFGFGLILELYQLRRELRLSNLRSYQNYNDKNIIYNKVFEHAVECKEGKTNVISTEIDSFGMQ
jgi:hypothetical protein